MKMNSNSTLTALAGVLALGALACDAMTLVGTVPDAGIANGYRQDGGGTCTPPTYANDEPFTLPAGVAGSWTGYYQGCPSPTGSSDVIKMTLVESAGGSGQIDLVFGTNPPPPPATDATDYYPPGFTFGNSLFNTFEGVSYRAHSVTWQDHRLKFLLAAYQVWDGWCQLQSSYRVAGALDGYACTRGTGGSWNNVGQPNEECIASDGFRMTPVPCAQFFLCGRNTCTCDMCGCAGSTTYTDQFDLTFDGDLVTGVGTGCSVRLTRDAP
jgi:hypothetical protein